MAFQRLVRKRRGKSITIPDSEIDKLDDALEDWLSDLIEKLEGVVDHYADKVYDEAYSRVPVRTGNLRSTIEKILTQMAAEASYVALVGTNKTTYAEFVERGTKKMDAQPYLAPALWEYAEDFIDEIRSTVEQHAKKASQYQRS